MVAYQDAFVKSSPLMLLDRSMLQAVDTSTPPTYSAIEQCRRDHLERMVSKHICLLIGRDPEALQM
jgi:hypothetical protein